MAITLSVLLIMTVYGAIDLTRKYSAAGQDQVERDQLGRSVLREIESDLRGLIYRDSAPLLREELAHGLSIRVDRVNSRQSDEARPTSIGLAGDSQSLMLRSHRQHLWVSSDSLETTGDNHNAASGGRWLAYAMAANGQVRMPGESHATLSPETSRRTKPILDGLVRLELDGTLMARDAGNRGYRPRVEQAELLSRAVADIQFQYFDGSEWATSWDSTTTRSIPQAVEVTADIADGPSADLMERAEKRTAGRDRYRMVIVLPMATVSRNSRSSSRKSQ